MARNLFFAFSISDSMFLGLNEFPSAKLERTPMTGEEVKNLLEEITSGRSHHWKEVKYCLNPSHLPTIKVAEEAYGLPVEVPEVAPRAALGLGDALIVMQVCGLPRLGADRHEYTAEEIASATFSFAKWEVISRKRTEAEINAPKVPTWTCPDCGTSFPVEEGSVCPNCGYCGGMVL